MIQPNELRLGNYVQDRGGKVLKIDTFETTHNGEEYVLKVGQRMFVNGNEVHPLTEYSDYLDPIPLTKDWLTRFGFDKYPNEVWSLLLWSPCLIDRDGYFLFAMHGVIVTEIQYVHQLQNLYFALTGEELKLNEKQ